MIRLISLEQKEEDTRDREKRELEKEEKGSGGRRDGGCWKRKGTEFVKLDISNYRGFKQSLRVTEEGKSSV